MAGAGYKLFNTGDVLTAAQVNTYLQEQTVMVFASSTARTTALSGVLAEGMMSYLQDTNAVEVYNGTSWVNVGNAGDITEVQAGVGISIASGTGPIPVITNSSTDLITTAGDILYGTAADTMARLGIGTAGQVLKVNSGATAPEWGTAAGGNKTYTLLNTGGTAMSGSTTVTVNVATKEDYYILVMAADSGSRFAMDFRINGDTGANYAFTNIRWDIDGATYSPSHYFSASSTGLTLINLATASTNAASTVSAGIYVGAGNSTTLHPVSYQTGGTASGGNAQDLITGTAMYSGSAAITSFSFIAATSFTGGTIYVYGA